MSANEKRPARGQPDGRDYQDRIESNLTRVPEGQLDHAVSEILDDAAIDAVEDATWASLRAVRRARKTRGLDRVNAVLDYDVHHSIAGTAKRDLVLTLIAKVFESGGQDERS